MTTSIDTRWMYEGREGVLTANIALIVCTQCSTTDTCVVKPTCVD